MLHSQASVAISLNVHLFDQADKEIRILHLVPFVDSTQAEYQLLELCFHGQAAE